MGWAFYDDSFSFQWNELVEVNPNGRFIHLTGFQKVVQKCYGLEPIYLAYLERNRILSLFPGFFHRSFLLGKKIISQPFSEYGGLLFCPALAAEKKIIIIEEFLKVMEKILAIKEYRALEMRHPLDFLEMEALETETRGFKPRKLFWRSWLEIKAPEHLWPKLDPKERNIIRKAQAYQLKFEAIEDLESLREKFYPLYLRTMKRLGSPPHPFIYFSGLWQQLRPNLHVFIIIYRSRPVAALAVWAVGRTVHITDMVSDERFFFVKPNDLAIWEFLKWAYHRGFKIFDFGPVRYRGQEIFKRKWLLTVDDYYYVYLAKNSPQVKNIFSQSSLLTPVAPFLTCGEFLAR
jgi:hypothetical protein